MDWLVSHAGLEVPELDVPAVPEPTPQAQATPVAAAISDPRPDDADEDSDSASSDSSDDIEIDEAGPVTGMVIKWLPLIMQVLITLLLYLRHSINNTVNIY